MKVAMVSMNVMVGNCEENIQHMLQYIHRARKEQVDLIIFPQNAVSGYLLYEQWMDDAWCQYVDQFNDVLIQESYDIAIVWGNIRYRNKRRFQAAFFAYEGKTHMRVKKNEHLPYMQDIVYFEESKINSAIEYKGYVMALNFKDDIQIADININIDSYLYDIQHQRTWKATQLYVNASGIQYHQQYVHGLDGYCVYMQDGQCFYAASCKQQEYHVVTLHQKSNITKKLTVYDMLCTTLRLFDEQIAKQKQWIIPIRNDLESMLCASMCVSVLGKHRVIGVVVEQQCSLLYYENLGISLKRLDEEKTSYQAWITMLAPSVIVDTFYKTDRILKHNPYLYYPHLACSILGDLSKEEVHQLMQYMDISQYDYKLTIEDEFVSHLHDPLFLKDHRKDLRHLIQKYQEMMVSVRPHSYILCVHHHITPTVFIPTLTFDK